MRAAWVFLLWTLSCQGVILETQDVTKALEHVEAGAICVFDLDNTLVEPPQHLGSDPWVTHAIERSLKQGKSLQDALHQVVINLVEIHSHTGMQLVDVRSLDVLEQLKARGIPCVGLTKRDPQLAARTLEQLKELGVHFHPILKESVFKNLNGTFYKEGVIFVGPGIDKGPALLAYLKKCNLQPKCVVMVDDKKSYLQEIETTLQAQKIPFVGMRYGALDEKVKGFSPEIADLQLEHLHKILSDEDALHLLQKRASTSQEPASPPQNEPPTPHSNCH
jgi:hypothetical protein